MDFAILSLPKSISFYFGHLDCFFFCVNSFWAFGHRTLIFFTCSFSSVFLFQNRFIPQNSLSASLLVLKLVSGYQAGPFLNWNRNLKCRKILNRSHHKVHTQELPCEQHGPGHMQPKKHVAKNHQSVSELLALTMGHVDTVGENRDLVRTQGRWKGGAESAGRNGEPAPRVMWAAREAPRWCGFHSTNLLSFRETSPPHELQASLIAAGCPGMGSDPSTTTLCLPPPRQARVLENRDWLIHLCVPFCLAHCSSHCSLNRCSLSWTQVHIMLVPTYTCSETLNQRKCFILLLCLLTIISMPTLTVFSGSFIFISQLLFLFLSSLKFLRFLLSSSSFLLPCASHFHDVSILLTSNSIQFISAKCEK